MKKITKKLLVVILTLILLVINTNFAFAVEIVSPGIKLESPQFFDAAVSTLDLSVYFNFDEFNDYLVEQLKVVDGTSSTLATINISKFNIPKNDAVKTALQEHIWYNSPELFRIGDLGIGYSGDKYTFIQFYSYYTKEEYAEMHEKMVTEAEKLLKGIKGNTNLTEVEKALILHDRLASHCEYDYDTLKYDYSNMPRSSYNAYGVLVLRDAVCMGYALAYDYLLEQVGIKTLYCSSDTLNHAWNIVYIDNTPYHVDVTWDDPVWDMYGRVSHDNFLRSTQGMKDTGHTATDFFSFPTNTTYDDYYWQNCESAFQLIDNDFYYHDATTNNICKLNDISSGDYTEITSVPPSTWTTANGGYYPGNYTKFSGDSRYLYYNTKNKVFRYDPQNDNTEIIFEPDLTTYGAGYWIYGMVFSDCKIMCEIFSSPNYTVDVRKNYTVTVDVHTPSDWVITKEPTMNETGEKQRTCLNCSCVLNTEVIPKMLICATENTDTVIDENIVFTSTDLCQDIEDLVTFSDNLTYEISASLKADTTEFLGTGSVISIYENGEKVSEYKIIVAGDLNGDSVCDVLDVACAELSVTNNRIPSADECYAANGTKKDVIDEASFQFVVNTALKVVL
ncbi:MAG: hypothetical protein IKJ86_02490 [Clostridia bacterium]|nr:hypothetical protein [Clostridia bacterium]